MSHLFDRFPGQTHRQEEKDVGEVLQLEPLLERIIRLPYRRDGHETSVDWCYGEKAQFFLRQDAVLRFTFLAAGDKKKALRTYVVLVLVHYIPIGKQNHFHWGACIMRLFPSPGLWLRSNRWRWSYREDKAGLEPEQRLQAGIQALEGGFGKPKEANHQVARTAGRDCYFIGLGWAIFDYSTLNQVLLLFKN